MFGKLFQKSFWVRVRSALILIALLVGVILAGKWPLALLMSVFCGLAAREMNRINLAAGLHPWGRLISVLVVAYPFCAGISSMALQTCLAVSVLAVFAAAVWRGLREVSSGILYDLAANLQVLLYVGWLPSHLVLLRGLDTSISELLWSGGLSPHQWPILFTEGGVFLTFLAGFMITGNDTASYVVGSVAGKRRVAGSISPNKTVKGTIAGVLVGTAVGAAFVYLYPTNWPAISDKVPVWIVLIVLLLLNGLAQLGDLAESLMKRSAGVKDSGSYIAGHGGILDRFDSHIPVVAAAYYLLVPLV